MPTVSVIIPAYNAEQFIADTVQSVLDQTFQDFEIIVVDDGSKDGTVAALGAFGDRIQVHCQSNAGVAKARNNGVRLARGTWIAFLDADDLWLPTKLEKQLALSGVPMSYTDRLNIGQRGDLPDVQSTVRPMHSGDIFLPLLLEGNFITNTSVLIRRDLFQELGGFYTGLNGTEDWDLWIRVAERNPVGFIPEQLVKYRFHNGGISNNYARMNRDRMEVLTRAFQLDRSATLSWKVRRQIRAETWRQNGWDAGRSGARWNALAGYARAAAAWPLYGGPYKEALKVCLNV